VNYQKKRKYQVSGNPVDENALLMAEVRLFPADSHRLTKMGELEDWKNVAWSNESRFQMIGSEFGLNNLKAWIHPALSTDQAAAGGVVVWIFSCLVHIGPLSAN